MHPTLIFLIAFGVSLILEPPATVDAAASFLESARRITQTKATMIVHTSWFRRKQKGYDPHNAESALYHSNHPEVEDVPLPSASRNSRRDFLSQPQRASALMLSSLILGPGSVFAESLSESSTASSNIIPKTIVITGANSGIGLEACKQLSQQGHTLVFACRSLDKAEKAVEAIQQQDSSSGSLGRLIPMECDLASLSSVKSFAAGLKDSFSSDKVLIDTLCLNAGVARNTEAKDCARTKEGFELTGA